MTKHPKPNGHLVPSEPDVPRWTDKYFTRTKDIVAKFGDAQEP